MRRASRYKKLRAILQPHQAGHMLNNLHRATVIDQLPSGHEAADQDDAWLLALAEVGHADYKKMPC